MKVRLEEYKSVTIEQIMELTGLENPWSDQSKYSLARQKGLLLQQAREQNVLYKVEESHPIEHKVVTCIKDKGLSILYSKTIEEPKAFSSTLNLNEIPHKVIREYDKVIIEVNKRDIPDHILPNPKPKFSYNVIGILTEEKCHHNGFLYRDINFSRVTIGIKYRFGFHNKVSLHVLI